MQLLDKDGKTVEKILFDIVDVGTSKTLQFTLHNNEGTYVDQILVNIEDKEEKSEIKVTQYQTFLSDEGKTTFNVTWTPTLKVKRKLELDFSVKYRNIWG